MKKFAQNMEVGWLADGQCPAEKTEGEEKERQLHSEEAVRCKTKANACNPTCGVTERIKKHHTPLLSISLRYFLCPLPTFVHSSKSSRPRVGLGAQRTFPNVTPTQSRMQHRGDLCRILWQRSFCSLQNKRKYISM